MESKVVIIFLSLAINYFSGVNSAKFTLNNNCPDTIWPAMLTGGGLPQLPLTGFELPSKSTKTIEIAAPWSGRFWARSSCKVDGTGKFVCETADCASGQVSCNGAGAIPPASLAEFTLGGYNGKDFYDISLVDGFNVPVSVTPQGGSGDCKSTGCRANVNAKCPPELAVKLASSGGVIGCKSACVALNQPQYCCTGNFGTPQTCKPTSYSKLFKGLCPQAYSYAYDDESSTFTCKQANLITFCPS